ncbi:hypothetical protein GCM10020255_007570 [Rhodococcus baikonurensis]
MCEKHRSVHEKWSTGGGVDRSWLCSSTLMDPPTNTLDGLVTALEQRPSEVASVRAAARRTATSWALLLRRIEDGNVSAPVETDETDDGWPIGVDDLLGARFALGRPRPPAVPGTDLPAVPLHAGGARENIVESALDDGSSLSSPPPKH